MTKLATTLVDSLKLLARQPKLFLPKIFVSFLYGVGMLLTADIMLKLLAIDQIPMAATAPLLQSYFGTMVLLAVYTFLVLLVDVFVNSMYPAMAQEFFNAQKISFRKAVSSICHSGLHYFSLVILNGSF